MYKTLIQKGILGFILVVLLSACNEKTSATEIVEAEVPENKPDYFLEDDAIFGIHFAYDKEEVASADTRSFLRYQFFPAWKDLFPGSQAYYLRPDRGPRAGAEMMLWIFQNKAARNEYFPEKDFPTEKFESIRGSINWLYTDTTYYKYFEAGWNGTEYSADYEVLDINQEVNKEWLVDDAIMVFEHLDLKPDVDTAAFEQFARTEWASSNSSPNPNVLKVLLKCVRGYRMTGYTQLYIFSNILERNDYFPYEGRPVEAGEVKVDPEQVALDKYAEPTSDEEEGHYEVVY